jgi:hypothetical protein
MVAKAGATMRTERKAIFDRPPDSLPGMGPSTSPEHSVESSKTHPLNLSGKTAVRLRGRAEFRDAEHWDELALAFLPRYDLPRWDRSCAADELERWLDRLDIPVRAFLALGAYASLADFISLNPAWPLRAAIGLALELRAA